MKYPAIFILVIIAFSCGKNLETPFSYETSSLIENHSSSDAVTRADISSPTIFDTSDPFNIHNIHAALESSSKTPSVIKPTHRLIKITPNDEQEQRRLESNPAIFVNYSSSPMSDYKTIDNPRGIVDNSFLSIDAPECGNLDYDTDSLTLSDLWVVWPIECAVPDTINYRECYDLFLPGQTLQENCEALNSLFNSSSSDTKRTVQNQYLSGKISFYDSFLQSAIDIANLRIRVQLGSYYQDFTTNQYGAFQIPRAIPWSATVSYVLQNDDFTITEGLTSTPVIKTLGIIGDLWEDLTSPYYCKTFVIQNSFPENIYRAAKYYYNFKHYSWFYDTVEGISIRAIDAPNQSSNGAYYYSHHPVDIYIYHNSNSPNHVISTVLHELGHSSHHLTVEGTTSTYTNHYYNCHRGYRESFASFTGWYFGERYYLSKGYIRPYVSYHINHNHRQGWTGNIADDYYSPLFVDMIDEFDQSTSGGLSDNLSSIPLSLIKEALVSCDSLHDVATLFRSFATENHFLNNMSDYLNQYSIWFQ